MAWVLAMLLSAVSVYAETGDDSQNPIGKKPVEFHGAGWVQLGRVEESFTTSAHKANSYQKNWLQNSGGYIGSRLQMGGGWEGGFGLGVVQTHLARGNRENAYQWYAFWVPFIQESRISREMALTAYGDSLELTLGSFNLAFNPEAKDLGNYLLKGYVYPGTLVPVSSSQNGAMLEYRRGGFSNRLLAILETEDKPLYDVSIADYLEWSPVAGLTLGGGINAYRVWAQDRDLTSPTRNCNQSGDFGQYNVGCNIVDSIGTNAQGQTIFDTTTGSLSGIKLGARFRLDPKPLFGMSERLGGEDLVIYGEAAVLGLRDYPKYYRDIKQRIPVMVGFNLPMFRILDRLGFEVEYYASKNNSDNLGAQYGSWVPTVDPEFNAKRDDWKWAVTGSRTITGMARASFLVANDHIRLGGSHNLATGVEATTTPKDWYWTGKLEFFF